MEQLWFIANLAEVLEDRDGLLARAHALPAGDKPPLHVHEARATRASTCSRAR